MSATQEPKHIGQWGLPLIQAVGRHVVALVMFFVFAVVSGFFVLGQYGQFFEVRASLLSLIGLYAICYAAASVFAWGWRAAVTPQAKK